MARRRLAAALGMLVVGGAGCALVAGLKDRELGVDADAGDASLEDASDASDASDAPDAPDAPPFCTTGCEAITQVAAGATSACVLKASGHVYCWGENDSSELGVEDPAPAACGLVPCSPKPVRVPIDRVTSIAVGWQFACAVRDDKTLWCWGSNAAGRLGVPDAGDNSCGKTFGDPPCSATPVSPLGDVEEVALGRYGGCARFSEAGVACWGSDGDETDSGGVGALGAGRVGGIQSRPFSVPALANLRTTRIVVSMGGHACATTATEVYCWGDDRSGALGQASAGAMANCKPAPTENNAAGQPCNPQPGVAVSASNVALLTLGLAITCYVVPDAGTEIVCLGTNFYGQFGTGASDSTPHSDPVAALTFVDPVADLSTRFHHTCAITTAQDLFCWGNDGDGELGQGTYAENLAAGSCADSGAYCLPKPQAVDAGASIRWARVAAGVEFTVAVDTDGGVWAWGGNTHGELGHAPDAGGDVRGCRYTSSATLTTCNPFPQRVKLPADP